MKRFQGVDAKDVHNALRQVIAENSEGFEDQRCTDLLPVVYEKQFLASAMDADICSTNENMHVWGFAKFKNAICSGCHEKFQSGMICLKCHMYVHPNCSKYTKQCQLEYHHDDSTSKHIFSNKVLDGQYDECFNKFTEDDFGSNCRWCRKNVGCFTNNAVPILVVINPNAGNGYGQRLLQEFSIILHPMQVINAAVTDPYVGFERFRRVKHFLAITIGGNRLFSYVMRAFRLIRHRLMGDPRFRFIPIGPNAEVGRCFGGRIKYKTKTAEYILDQIPRLKTYDVDTWTVCEKGYNDPMVFREDFVFTFGFGMETYEDMILERDRLWIRIVKAVIPTRIYNWHVRRQEIKRWGSGPEPPVDEYLTLEINGERVNLSDRRYTAIIFINRIRRGDDSRGGLIHRRVTDGTIDIYGITEYTNLTRRGVRSRAYKLGQTNEIKVCIMKNCPFQADGYSNIINYVEPDCIKELDVQLNTPIRVLALSNEYVRKDKPLTRRGRREDEDAPLDKSECFLEDLEKEIRRPQVEKQKSVLSRIIAQVLRNDDTDSENSEEREEAERQRAIEERELAERKRAAEQREARIKKAAKEKEEAERKRVAKEKEEAERKRAAEEREARRMRAAREQQKTERIREAKEWEEEERKRAAEERYANRMRVLEEQEEALRRRMARQREEAERKRVAEELEARRKRAAKEQEEAESKRIAEEEAAGTSKCKDKKKEDDKKKDKSQKTDEDEAKQASAMAESSESKEKEDKKKKKEDKKKKKEDKKEKETEEIFV